MELNLAGQFLYFLMLVCIYAGPVLLVLLLLAWRRGHLRRALLAAVASLPIMALLVLGWFHLDLHQLGKEHDRQGEIHQVLFGEGPAASLYPGHSVGKVEIHGRSMRVFRYRLAGSIAEIELQVPTELINMGILLRRSEANSSTGETAQLLVLNSLPVLPSPEGDAQAFVASHFPDLELTVPDHQLLILVVYDSHLSIWYRHDGMPDWFSNPVFMDASLQELH